MDFLVQSVANQPQCELMYGNKFCERSCDFHSRRSGELNRKLICFCPKAWEKDCSDYESDKLNTTDVELETAQPVRTPRVFPGVPKIPRKKLQLTEGFASARGVAVHYLQWHLA